FNKAGLIGSLSLQSLLSDPLHPRSVIRVRSPRPIRFQNETAGEPIPGGGRSAEAGAHRAGHFFSGRIVGSLPRTMSMSLSLNSPLRKEWADFTVFFTYSTTVTSDSGGRV